MNSGRNNQPLNDSASEHYTIPMQNEILWTPTPSSSNTEMARYLKHVSETFPIRDICDYDSLYRWSVDHYDEFWQDWFHYSGIIFNGDATPVLTGSGLRGTRFFPQVHLNFAENLMRHLGASTALAGISESRGDQDISFDELRSQVGTIQQRLKQRGIESGDRVAAFVPNIPETVVAALATAASGAIWSSCSPDFGTQSVIDRFEQIEPKLLFCVNGFVHNGKTIDCREKIIEISAQLPSLQTIVVIELIDLPIAPQASDVWFLWNDWTAGEKHEPIFKRLPFNHPLYIMYSSGTTGKPKCIVHGAGGTLLQQTKELILHTDVRPGDNITYITTCGWMMWNWLIAALYTGAEVTLFDGFPAVPTIARLWDLIDQRGITHFGTSPKYLGACRRRLTPSETHNLSSLRVIMSTGAPLQPEDFDWIYQSVKPNVQLSSISGGTDIISCFMLGNPLLSVHRGEIQCLGLGMHVESVDSQFHPLDAGSSQKGELVCRTPFVSMPVMFWNDTDGEKYRQAYFSEGGERWAHGDLIAITGSQGKCGGVIVYGRSDATLKPGGVRIGTAEIYRIVENLPEVADSLVIGQPWRGDIRVVLYIKLKLGFSLDNLLKSKIRSTLQTKASAKHAPGLIIEVDKIPYTRSGKKVELAIRDIAMGLEPTNREALQDPTAFDEYYKLS